MNKITIAIVVLWCSLTKGFSQSTPEPIPDTITTVQIPSYVNMGFGVGYTSIRDFATSPLIFEGISRSIDLGYLKTNRKKEIMLGATYMNTDANSDTNNEELFSTMHSLTLRYSRLYRLPVLSNARWNIKVGGELNATGNLRITPEFRNNGIGAEAVGTLFGVAKVQYTFPRKTRELSYQLNVGVLNTNYRNGYAYIDQRGILNDDDRGGDYQFNFFSGFRMHSELHYTWYLRTKNAMRVSYIWDAYKTGSEFDVLEMATHQLRFTFLFKTK